MNLAWNKKYPNYLDSFDFESVVWGVVLGRKVIPKIENRTHDILKW